jgi:hypothetical protein
MYRPLKFTKLLPPAAHHQGNGASQILSIPPSSERTDQTGPPTPNVTQPTQQVQCLEPVPFGNDMKHIPTSLSSTVSALPHA